MTNIEAQSPVILTGRKLSAVKWGWWVLFVIYTIFRGFEFDFRIGFIWNYLHNISNYVIERPKIVETSGTIVAILTIIYIFTAWVLALIIFLKKPNNLAALLVSVMFIMWEVDSSEFWNWALGFTPIANLGWEIRSYVESILLKLFLGGTQIIVMAVFLTFPSGRWMSNFARKVFIAIASLFAITWVTEVLLLVAGLYDLFSYLFEISSAFIFIVPILFSATVFLWSFRKIQDATQRQQVKWIVVFLILFASSTLIFITVYFLTEFTNNSLNNDYYFSYLVLPIHFTNLGLYISFSFSIFRYRLWDIEIIINKAAVYSVLTALLGLVALVSAAILDYLIKKLFGENASIWSVIVSALPLAAAFKPLRDWSQSWVDHYFKPEEVNFENHFLEFRTDIRSVLDTSRIIQIISRQVKKQLNVEAAQVYLADENDKVPQLALSDEILRKLVNGDMVIGEGNAEYSLLIPLMVTRPVIPDFIGVVLLGCRLNGRGYSTPMLESLKILGANAGEAIYLSQLNEQAKIKATSSQS